MSKAKMGKAADGLARKQWMDGEKGRAAYVGSAVHGRIPGVGAFVLVSDDAASLGMLWNIVVGDSIEMDVAHVKTVGVCSIEHINELAGKDGVHACGDCGKTVERKPNGIVVISSTESAP